MAHDEENYNAQGDKKPFFSASSGSYSNPMEGTGFQIGPYRLLSVLGEGGYGIVYLAAQQSPIRRQVALKIVKLGMDTKQVIARFEAERQALALLDHSNIAHIYDAGTTETGRPYFVMELVKGSAITEYCDWQKLDIEERLELFLDVCDAVQYAHQKGIIHRDIKPSNILVSIEGGGAVPKVIDFGVAKAISQPLTERTLVTEQGQFIGTPEYMSPEQADMAVRDIDTRSDIYSLGAVLYELLTGVLPFDPKAFREAGVDRLRQMIREEEPKTPSTRLSRLGEIGEEIAAKRRTKVGSLSKCLRDELEWIPMKAMRKERTYRYRSAAELADDIRNYLSRAPLIAGPESVTYRLKKFVRRRRRIVTAAAALTVSVLVGFVVSTTMYFQAEQQRSIAEKARIAEAEQTRVAAAERDRAVRAEQEAKKRLVDLYEQQGRRYIESGSLDEALVVLSEAYNVDNQRLSVRFLLAECMRKHRNPAFQKDGTLIPWDKSAGTARISAFSVSPDRTCVAFVDETLGLVNVFDTTTGRLMAQLPGKAITRLAFAPGSRYIVVKTEQDSTHHTLKVFNIPNGKEVLSIKRSNTDIDRLYESIDYTLPERGELEKVYDSLCMSPNGDWFVFVDVVDSDHELKPQISLWDFESGKLHRTQNQHFNSLISVLIYIPESFFGHGTRLVTLDSHGLAQFWDLPALESIGESRAFASALSVIMDPKKFILLEDMGATLYDRRANRSIITFPTAVWAGFSPNGKRIVTKQIRKLSNNVESPELIHSINLWDTADGGHVAELTGNELRNWHFTSDSRCLITEYVDGQINVWNVENGNVFLEIRPEEGQAVTDISPDSRWLITRSSHSSPSMKVWNLVTGDCFAPYEDEVRLANLTTTWLSVDVDRIFSVSHISPTQLPRFNADGTCLITISGLRNITAEHQPPESILSIVKAHVPLRLENGRIRPASTEELLQAKLDYCVMEKGQEDAETIRIALEFVAYAIQTGELDEASQLAMDLQLLRPRGNVDLAQHGRAVINQLSKAYADRAEREQRRGKYAAAVADYESALRFDPNNPLTLKDLAWLQATCPDSQLLDVHEALERSKKACELTNWKHWEYLSTHAVACAAGGQFESAIDYQQKSVELLPPECRDKWEANFQERLRLFRSNQPYNQKLFWNLPVDNMIAWWKFDEAKGHIAFDSSGNNHHGVLVGDPQWQPGQIESALLLAQVGDFVDCGNDPSFDIPESITVALWTKVQPSEPNEECQIIIGKGSRSWKILLDKQSDSFIFACAGVEVPGDLAPNIQADTYSTGLVSRKKDSNGYWHHIVGVYDGESMFLYVDGSLSVSAAASGTIDSNKDPLSIGADLWPYSKWKGLVDDVRIYNRALSSDEVCDLYDATK